MKAVAIVLLIALCFMLLVCYACVSNSSRISRAEERMKQFYKEWKEKDDE